MRLSKLTSKEVDELMRELLSLPDEPIGPCLTDDEFFGYFHGTLDRDGIERVEAHLASCGRCSEEAARLALVAQSWCGRAGRKRLIQFRKRLLANPPEPVRQWLTEEKAARTHYGWRRLRNFFGQVLRIKAAWRGQGRYLKELLGPFPSPEPSSVRGEDRYKEQHKRVEGDPQLKKWGYDAYELFILPGKNGHIRFKFSLTAVTSPVALTVELFRRRKLIKKQQTDQLHRVYFEGLELTESVWDEINYVIRPVDLEE